MDGGWRHSWVWCRASMAAGAKPGVSTPPGPIRYQPVKGDPEVWEADRLDITRACLEGFARAAAGGPALPISLDEMIHGAAVTEAVVRSAASGNVERVT